MEKKEMLESFLTEDNLDYIAVFQKINFDEYDFDNEMQNDKKMPIMLINASKMANDSVIGQNFGGEKIIVHYEDISSLAIVFENQYCYWDFPNNENTSDKITIQETFNCLYECLNFKQFKKLSEDKIKGTNVQMRKEVYESEREKNSKLDEVVKTVLLGQYKAVLQIREMYKNGFLSCKSKSQTDEANKLTKEDIEQIELCIELAKERCKDAQKDITKYRDMLVCEVCNPLCEKEEELEDEQTFDSVKQEIAIIEIEKYLKTLKCKDNNKIIILPKLTLENFDFAKGKTKDKNEFPVVLTDAEKTKDGNFIGSDENGKIYKIGYSEISALVVVEYNPQDALEYKYNFFGLGKMMDFKFDIVNTVLDLLEEELTKEEFLNVTEYYLKLIKAHNYFGKIGTKKMQEIKDSIISMVMLSEYQAVALKKAMDAPCFLEEPEFLEKIKFYYDSYMHLVEKKCDDVIKNPDKYRELIKEENSFEETNGEMQDSLNYREDHSRAITSMEDLEKIGEDLTAKYEGENTEEIGKYIVGRDAEIKRMIDTLGKMNKRSMLILGKQGSGKTALLEALAYKIAQGEIPSLEGAMIFKLDPSLLFGGIAYQGMLEERVGTLLKFVSSLDRRVILFIDEFQTVLEAGSTHTSSYHKQCFITALKTYITDKLTLIGATTFDEYKRFSKDGEFGKNNVDCDMAFLRRFEILKLSEISEEQTMNALRKIVKPIEKYHGVSFGDVDLLIKAVTALVKSDNNRITSLVDEVKDIIDYMGSYLKNHPEKTVADAYEIKCNQIHEDVEMINDYTQISSIGFGSGEKSKIQKEYPEEKEYLSLFRDLERKQKK